MINMESGDIVDKAPGLILVAEATLVGDASVTALGGYLLQGSSDMAGDASMTGDLLGDVEMAADLVGSSSFTGAAGQAHAAVAWLEGSSKIVVSPIVRPATQPLDTRVRTTKETQRLAGYQPNRKPAVKKPTFSVSPKR
jgi:hypothetical protein